MWGRQDRMIPPNLARQFVALNPNLELVELDNAGHCPHDECPEQVNQILLDWLARQCPAQKDNQPSSVSATN
jgi:haloalkane dehalogenase